MRIIWKILFIMILCITAHILIVNFPVISAALEDNRYVDGEVYVPQNGDYDFKLFKL